MVDDFLALEKLFDLGVKSIARSLRHFARFDLFDELGLSLSASQASIFAGLCLDSLLHLVVLAVVVAIFEYVVGVLARVTIEPFVKFSLERVCEFSAFTYFLLVRHYLYIILNTH